MYRSHQPHKEPVALAFDENSDPEAKNLGKVLTELASRKQRFVAAAASFRAMFDQAMVRTGAARVQAGWAASIRVRQYVDERCYYAPGQHGTERTLSLFLLPPPLDGDFFEGAYIQPGGVHPAIYVVPTLTTAPARWLLQTSGSELTSEMVEDLFRATFSDDIEAVQRLGPLYSFGRVAMPTA
ncbi:MAG TPA: hypothetical protein VNL35_08935 [Chloroflexota bacterium]|nr:hypothetical protein [Chloroflexota bacterium]